ncbi:MAG: phosphoheptose isomerase [Bacteroidetes bacterium]|nr:MAG: phosphoheptose isomerase [Bacteroidota bacterium]
MSSEQIQKNFQEAKDVLEAFTADDSTLEAIVNAGAMLVAALKSGNKIISCGNGGSMSDAMHFAEELSGKFRNEREAMAAVSISDPSHITCTANDYGFEYIFSRYVEALGKEGDVLLAISTSGNSANVQHAIEAAKKKGLKVIGLTGNDGGKMAGLCDVEIRVSHRGYSDRIQEVHIKIIHSLIHFVELHT